MPYDAATYGRMEAKVERVGADAITDEKGESYFEVQLTAARDQLKLHGKPLPINHSPFFSPVPEPTIKTSIKAMSLAVLTALQR